LAEATTYYFQIKSGDQLFDNGGVPWTFTTLKQTEPEASPTQTEDTTAEPSPTVSLSPTAEAEPSPSINPTTVTKDTKCDLETYKTHYYTDTPEYDQDNNGIVNLRDWSLCNSMNNPTTPTP
jgi:hypothetical protein